MTDTPTGPVAAVHVADLPARRSVGLLIRKTKTGGIPGLRSLEVGMGSRFGSTPPRPQPARLGLITFWDSDAALDEFDRSHPLAAALSGGWHVRLDPLRAHGSWPGLADSVSRSRHTDRPGPFVVLTLARFRWPRAIAFTRTSAPAEKAVLDSSVRWVSPFVRPPFVSTCSIWDSEDDIAAYAYANAGGPHPHAVSAGRKKPFHRQEAFIRFHPYHVRGSLGGKNPLPAGLLATAT